MRGSDLRTGELFSYVDLGEPPSPGRNGERHFHGEQRSNETHSSTTDPEAKLAKKGKGKEAKLAYTGQRHDGEPQRLRRRGGTATGVGHGRARNRERHDRALFAGRQAHHRGCRQGAAVGFFRRNDSCRNRQ